MYEIMEKRKYLQIIVVNIMSHDEFWLNIFFLRFFCKVLQIILTIPFRFVI